MRTQRTAPGRANVLVPTGTAHTISVQWQAVAGAISDSPAIDDRVRCGTDGAPARVSYAQAEQLWNTTHWVAMCTIGPAVRCAVPITIRGGWVNHRVSWAR